MPPEKTIKRDRVEPAHAGDAVPARQMDFSMFSQDAGTTSPYEEDILPQSEKINVTIPVHIEYFLAGESQKRVVNTTVQMTTIRKKARSQQSRGGDSLKAAPQE